MLIEKIEVLGRTRRTDASGRREWYKDMGLGQKK